MVDAMDSRYFSPEEFLAWEAQQPERHEYLNGEAYAMAGGTLDHNAIAGNLFFALKAYLRGKPCRVFIGDVKVYVSEKGPYFYPDLVVTCDPRDFRSRQAIQYPCLIAEVLSPETAEFDRDQKFQQYARMESLKEYVLISSDRPALDRYYRPENAAPNCWEFTRYGATEFNPKAIDFDQQQCLLAEISFVLQSLNFNSTLAMIYEEVRLDRNLDNASELASVSDDSAL
ncbi:Uma2 family endonuclease [Limnothrix sp. FACHB-708]|uniref:Uma2 family endonuclease n=1 Tax=unclassified Limnothrix TaxID=2632864 RepID=UPI00168A3AF2|nr:MULTISPECIES: Uma2 family endonuclease [unclassified Limnothrix]MBD2553763.1 Uma2 family endonuclease [Limnothrix sp. FACHB-708]MBD2591234.1 Uma2 family endonuclease [Limnothrix sp. FACHB-406]